MRAWNDGGRISIPQTRYYLYRSLTQLNVTLWTKYRRDGENQLILTQARWYSLTNLDVSRLERGNYLIQFSSKFNIPNIICSTHFCVFFFIFFALQQFFKTHFTDTFIWCSRGETAILYKWIFKTTHNHFHRNKIMCVSCVFHYLFIFFYKNIFHEAICTSRNFIIHKCLEQKQSLWECKVLHVSPILFSPSFF